MDLARVHVGSPAVVTVVAYTDKVFKGQVDWVSGMLDPGTRTAKVRCTFDNPDKLLRPEMYATVQISVDQKRALAIPRNALLRLGEYKVVFVEVGRGARAACASSGCRSTSTRARRASGSRSSTGSSSARQVVVNGAILLSQKL